MPLFSRIISVALRARMAKGDMKNNMIALLNHHSILDNLLSDVGTKLGGGSHVKHRLTKYHDFFVDHIVSSDSILDVGCGGAELAIDIAERTKADVVGIDIEQHNIDRARKNAGNIPVEFICGDATAYTFEDNRFNTLVLSNVLEHIDQRPLFLKNLFLHTKAQKALIRVPVFERDWTVPMKKELGLDWRLDSTHFTEYTVPEFEEEMANAGVNIVSLVVRWSEIWAIVTSLKES